MKKAFVVFGVLLGLQLAAVTASAQERLSTIDFCGPRALFNPETGEKIVGRGDTVRAACAVRRESYQIQSAAFSTAVENNVDLRLVFNDYRGFSQYKWVRVSFGDLGTAQKFLAQVRSGQMIRAVAVLDESRMSELWAKNDIVSVSAAKISVLMSK